MLVKLKGPALAPAHTVALLTAFTTGNGLTVIVNVLTGPVHPLNVGVTLTTPLIDADPELVAVKEGVFAVPFAPRPIAVFEFVHANVAPDGVLAKLIAATAVPPHAVTFVTAFTVGPGLTVMVYEEGVPEQPPIVGVTVITALTGEAPVFIALNEGTFPVPLAARPMVVFEFVQAYVAPTGVLVNADAGTLFPLHTVVLVGTVTIGFAFTITDCEVLSTQPEADVAVSDTR